MDLKERIGVDLGRKAKLEDGIAWAGKNGVRYIDCELDVDPNALQTFDDRRAAGVRALLDKHGVKLGLHTLSAVNTAEMSPFVSDAVDQYLRAYIDAAKRLGAGWIVVHGGYHFTGDYQARMNAGVERLKRALGHAEKAGVKLLLENLNKEPDTAEVHYIPHNVEECKFFFDRLGSPALGWAFTVNHAHIVPEGIAGHVAALDLKACGEVRLADCRGDREEHLQIGRGSIDFAQTFKSIEQAGFRGHYMNAFGSLDDMLKGRDLLAEIAAAA
jgi:sugar phosphate isomerase/epimerase